jgi:hypothetical protein
MIRGHESEAMRTLPRVWRFFRKPGRQRLDSWVRPFRGVPPPIRLPFRARFLARTVYLGAIGADDEFKLAELAFIQPFLRPGVTVFDVGPHHGLCTFLASKVVRPSGKVISFEPSVRERNALRLNVVLGRCKNVLIQALALGNVEV